MDNGVMTIVFWSMTPCASIPTFQMGLLLHLQGSPRTVSCKGKTGIA